MKIYFDCVYELFGHTVMLINVFEACIFVIKTLFEIGKLT